MAEASYGPALRHSPKLPRLGEWYFGAFCSVLYDIRYNDPTCIEREGPGQGIKQSYHAAVCVALPFLF